MTRDEAFDLVNTTLATWVADPENDAVWSGVYEGRIGIRVAQQVRNYTTIWFDVGDRTVGAEAFLLPKPQGDLAEIYRYSLARNRSSWPAYIALDRQGDLFAMARTDTATLTDTAVGTVVGAIYEVVELSFARLVRIGFGKREKSL